jgi:hypothetical protein
MPTPVMAVGRRDVIQRGSTFLKCETYLNLSTRKGITVLLGKTKLIPKIIFHTIHFHETFFCCF